ncbi:MAG: immunoglobulin [Clostridiales bacterium]|nr:immunoglobulin [Clostridiales bacterium]
MSRRGLTLAEQETILLWDNELDTANVYTHDARLIAKLKELSEKYPEQFKLERRGPHRAVTYTVPKWCITIRTPYSEERRQQQIQEAAENGSPFKEEDTYAEN